MNTDFKSTYNQIRSGGTGFYEQKRGLIAVWGREAVQFLDGLISNDMKTLEDGAQMLAAFPNAQGRLLAVVRVLRQGERFLFDTEETVRVKIFNNLFRFTFAGDFFVEDLSEQFKYFEVYGPEPPALAGGVMFNSNFTTGHFVQHDSSDSFAQALLSGDAVEISDDLYETLRIENGIPKYGIDMDETTIVPELGIDELISYQKGCYIGQEIIARIHFRGHVAKKLTGLVWSQPGAAAAGFLPGADLRSSEGKNAGRITSVTISPQLQRAIALAYVRYDYLEEGTRLQAGDGTAEVKTLPFLS